MTVSHKSSVSLDNSPYGKELILDIHNCENLPCTRSSLDKFFTELCELIDMDKEDLFFWDYEGEEEAYAEAPPHLKGTSAVQFIKTSNITIHTLDEMKRVYLNVFSCKDFDPRVVVMFALERFGGEVVSETVVERI